MPWTIAFLLALSTIARFAIAAGAAYVVFWLDRSGWWFFVALILIGAVPAEFSYGPKPQGGAS